MELAEVKTAVLAGETVHWASSAYVVTHAGDDAHRGFCIVCIHNDSAIGLTWRDGVTMNGDVEDFYVAEDVVAAAERRRTADHPANADRYRR